MPGPDKRTLYLGRASAHPARWGQLVYPTMPLLLGSHSCPGEGKFKFKMSSSVRLVFSFQARAPCPTGCSIRNFAFNTAERTS